MNLRNSVGTKIKLGRRALKTPSYFFFLISFRWSESKRHSLLFIFERFRVQNNPRSESDAVSRGCSQVVFDQSPFHVGSESGIMLIEFFWVKNIYGVHETKNHPVTQSGFVVWGGIEPPTQGFSVLCSTDWATAPTIFSPFPPAADTAPFNCGEQK